MLEENHKLSIRRQCDILAINRSSAYNKKKIKVEDKIEEKIIEQYIESGCRYGYRKITEALERQGDNVNHKKVLAIMQKQNIQGVYPKKKFKYTKTEHKKYPYLLNDLTINHPDEVWATDITYVKLPMGFIYLVAYIDLYSRYIVAFNISITMEAQFCIDCLQEALTKGRMPIILNTDQGSQFTSNDFVSYVEVNDIILSMDAKGRCFDNIFMERFWRSFKQEDLYRHRYESVAEAKAFIAAYILWYNNQRLHQALGYKTPSEIYFYNKKAKEKFP
jgi:putative transposase